MNYDEQIELLTKHPQEIEYHWCSGTGLFKIINDSENHIRDAGCLTTIRKHPEMNKAYIKGVVNEELTREIAADTRIPFDNKDITVQDLPVFKEWQERIDKLQSNG